MSVLNNDFDRMDSELYSVYADLKNRKRNLRSGAWNNDLEHKMFTDFMREREEFVNRYKLRESVLKFPVSPENKKYFYEGGLLDLKTDRATMDRMYAKAAAKLANEGDKLSDLILLADTIDVVNEFFPLNKSVDFETQVNKRGSAIYNILRLFGVQARLIKGRNPITEIESNFVILSGRTKDNGVSRDTWQIVNPAAYSIISVDDFSLPYPNRCSLSLDQTASLQNSPSSFCFDFKAPDSPDYILSMIVESERKNATVEYVGNLDFKIENLEKFSESTSSHTQDGMNRA